MELFISGASGFIGRYLGNHLTDQGNCVEGASRTACYMHGYRKMYPVADITAQEWEPVLAGKEAVVHLANMAHVSHSNDTDALERYRTINTQETLNLAMAAVDAGVKRFVYISSIKVNGESASVEKPFLSSDVPAPQGPYAQSKWEAEQGLLALSRETGLEMVIIRPPLVYGPDVKGNLQLLSRMIDRGWPLPFASIRNQRDLISIDNLCSLIELCLTHPAAIGKTFLCADGVPLSTPDLIRKIAKAKGVNARLFPVPAALLKLGFAAGKKSSYMPLVEDVRVDFSDTVETLGWQPGKDIDLAFKKAFGPEADC